MAMIELFIPAPREYATGARGPKAVMDAWRRNTERAAISRAKVRGPCIMIANFFFPADCFSNEDALGPDLLLLFAPIYEALRTTVLSGSKQEDSWMNRIVINKVMSAPATWSGVKIQIDWDETTPCSEAENTEHRFMSTSSIDAA